MRTASLPSLETRQGLRAENLKATRFILAALLLAGLRVAGAQEWMYTNTDAGRPLRVEDAVVLPRYVLDAYMAPVLLVNGSASGTLWTLRPGLAYGLVPRTQVELAVPLGMRAGDAISVAGLQLAAQYSLNIETRTIPAIALEAGVLAPIGNAGVANAHPSIEMLVTRTHGWGRVHFNAGTLFGEEPVDSARVGLTVASLARWTTGVAVDRGFARSGILATAEILARQPMDPSQDAQWQVGAGVRYQLTPTTLLEAGVSGVAFRAPGSVSVSVGLGRTMALTALLPGLGRWGRR